MNNINNKNMHIDSIRNNLKIPLRTVSEYNSQNNEEIKNIKDIFLLEDNDKEKVLALLYLFSDNDNNEAISKFRDETKLLGDQYNKDSDLITSYNTMLVTALIYNPHFYAMAINYMGAVNSGIPVTETRQMRRVGLRRVGRFNKTFSKKTIYIAASAASVLIALFLLLNLNSGEKPVNTQMLASLSESDAGQLFIINPFMESTRSVSSRRDYKKILNEYSVLVKHNPDSPEVYINRGTALLKHGFVKSAIKDFNKALDLDMYNVDAYYHLAISYAGMENPDYEKAIYNINEVLATTAQPDSDKILSNEAFYLLGTIYYQQFKNTGNEEFLLQSISIFEQMEGYRNTGDILIRLENLK